MELSLFVICVIVLLEWHNYRLEKRNQSMEHLLKLAATRASYIKKITHDLSEKMDEFKQISEGFNETREYMMRLEGKLETLTKDHEELLERNFVKSDFVEGL